MNEWFILLLAGFLPTEIFRWLGVFFSRGLDEESAAFTWIKAVATATMAAVVAKLLFFPSGELKHIALSIRLLALTCGLVAFYLGKRSIIIGVLTGEFILFLMNILYP